MLYGIDILTELINSSTFQIQITPKERVHNDIMIMTLTQKHPSGRQAHDENNWVYN